MKGFGILLVLPALSRSQGGYAEQYTGHYYQYADQYAGNYSKYADQYARDFGKYADEYGGTQLVAANGTPGLNSSRATDAAHEVKTAENAIKALHALSANYSALLHNKTLAHAAADAVVAEAFKEHEAQHAIALRDFEHNLSALNATLLAKENATDVKNAFRAARRAEEELGHVEKATVHAMKKGIHRMIKSGKAQVHGLKEKGKEAARRAKKLGKRAAEARRAAGSPEREYENMERHSGRSAERLERRVEQAGRHAEREVEGGVRRVEDVVRDRARSISRDSESAWAMREHSLHLAARAVAQERQRAAAEAEARNTSAGANAASSRNAYGSAGAGSPSNHSSAAGRAQEAENRTGHQEAKPSSRNHSSVEGRAEEGENRTGHQQGKLGSHSFLAGAASGTAVDTGMLTACTAMVIAAGAVSAAAVARRAGRSTVRIGMSPSLG